MRFQAASLSLHMGTNLQILCHVAQKALLTKDPLLDIRDSIRIKALSEEVESLHEMLKSHWCSGISSLANKVLNENSSAKPQMILLTESIKAFNDYITTSAKGAFQKLNRRENQVENYQILAECMLPLTLVFNRKGIGEVQFLKIATYERKSGRENHQESIGSLTNLKKAMAPSFKRVVVFGKGSKTVPILFMKQMFVDALLNIRRTTDIVPKSNTYLFARPGSQIGGRTDVKLFVDWQINVVPMKE